MSAVRAHSRASFLFWHRRSLSGSCFEFNTRVGNFHDQRRSHTHIPTLNYTPLTMISSTPRLTEHIKHPHPSNRLRNGQGQSSCLRAPRLPRSHLRQHQVQWRRRILGAHANPHLDFGEETSSIVQQSGMLTCIPTKETRLTPV